MPRIAHPIPGGLLDTLPPDAARIQAVVRLLELQQQAMAGDERARAELAALMEGRQWN